MSVSVGERRLMVSCHSSVEKKALLSLFVFFFCDYHVLPAVAK